MKKIQLQEGDIIRYPIGFTLAVRRVYRNSDGDLYVRECINEDDEYERYIYKSNYETWDNSLYKEPGFDLANTKEINYLQD